MGKNINVKSALQLSLVVQIKKKNIEADWHYLEFACGICSKNLVFKHLSGLIQHLIVKRPEEKYGEGTIYVKKSGISLTCRDHRKEASKWRRAKWYWICLEKK